MATSFRGFEDPIACLRRGHEPLFEKRGPSLEVGDDVLSLVMGEVSRAGAETAPHFGIAQPLEVPDVFRA
jgi:hypothetical protein